MVISDLRSLNTVLGVLLQTDIGISGSKRTHEERAHEEAAAGRSKKFRRLTPMEKARNWLNKVEMADMMICPEGLDLWSVRILRYGPSGFHLNGHIQIIADDHLEITVLGQCRAYDLEKKDVIDRPSLELPLCGGSDKELLHTFMNMFPGVGNLKHLQTVLTETRWKVICGGEEYHIGVDLYVHTPGGVPMDETNVSLDSIAKSSYSPAVKKMQRWLFQVEYEHVLLREDGQHWKMIFDAGRYRVVGALFFDYNRCTMAWFWAFPKSGGNDMKEGFKKNMEGFDDLQSFRAFFEDTAWENLNGLDITYACV